MALSAVLVDRARATTEQATGQRVEGSTMVRPVTTEWFRARLFLPSATEGEDPGRGRRRAVQAPTLMWGVRDVRGGSLLDTDKPGGSKVGFEDTIEVSSRQLGDAVWRVTQQPEPIRKRRVVIGFLAVMERAREAKLEPLVP